MKRLIVDMDNVMANISQHFIDWYQAKTGVRIDPASLSGLPEVEAFPQPEIVWQFLLTPGFFETVPVMKDSQQVLALLNEKYEVFIVSSALEFPQSLSEKFGWLAKHFPFITWKQIVFCGSKSVIKGDYMIDDYPKNLDYFDGVRLLYTSPHNELLSGYQRLNNWKEIEALLL